MLVTTLPAVAADSSWTLDPGPVMLIAVLGALYARRWVSTRREHGSAAAGLRHLVSALTAAVLLAAALISPVDRLAEQSFSLHMVQHVLLVDLVPIFVMLSFSKVLLRPLTRRVTALERAVGPLAHPAFAAGFYVLSMWLWHIPSLYSAALRSPSLHAVEHTWFLSAGMLYWWHLLSPIRSRLRGGAMAPIAYMLSTKIAVGLLGLGLTFAPDPLYGYYERRAQIFGFTAHTDQESAGAVMALEQSLVMGVALAFLFVRALDQSEREERRRDRLADRDVDPGPLPAVDSD